MNALLNGMLNGMFRFSLLCSFSFSRPQLISDVMNPLANAKKIPPLSGPVSLAAPIRGPLAPVRYRSGARNCSFLPPLFIAAPPFPQALPNTAGGLLTPTAMSRPLGHTR